MLVLSLPSSDGFYAWPGWCQRRWNICKRWHLCLGFYSIIYWFYWVCHGDRWTYLQLLSKSLEESWWTMLVPKIFIQLAWRRIDLRWRGDQTVPSFFQLQDWSGVVIYRVRIFLTHSSWNGIWSARREKWRIGRQELRIEVDLGGEAGAQKVALRVVLLELELFWWLRTLPHGSVQDGVLQAVLVGRRALHMVDQRWFRAKVFEEELLGRLLGHSWSYRYASFRSQRRRYRSFDGFRRHALWPQTLSYYWLARSQLPCLLYYKGASFVFSRYNKLNNRIIALIHSFFSNLFTTKKIVFWL